MQVAPLVIEILDTDAIDGGRGLQQRMEVQYNPTQYSLSKSAQIAEIAIPGLDAPLQQFIRGQTEKLTVELLFDTAAQGMGVGARDVRTLTGPVYELVRIQPKTHAPPRLRLTWGHSGLSFKAIVETIDQKFTLFSPEGIPLRATLTITFRGYATLEEQIADLKLESADQTKQHVVVRGESLSQIAWQELGDPAQWRVLADANSGRQMKNDVNVLNGGIDLALVTHIAKNKFGTLGYICGRAVLMDLRRQVVKNSDLMPCFEQSVCCVRSDKTGPSCNQNSFPCQSNTSLPVFRTGANAATAKARFFEMRCIFETCIPSKLWMSLIQREMPSPEVMPRCILGNRSS